MDIETLVWLKAASSKSGPVSLLDCTDYSSKSANIDAKNITKDSIYVDAVASDNGTMIKWFGQEFEAGSYTLSCKIEGAGLKGPRLLCTSEIEGSKYNSYYGAYYIDFTNEITFTTNASFSIGMVMRTETSGQSGKVYDIFLGKN